MERGGWVEVGSSVERVEREHEKLLSENSEKRKNLSLFFSLLFRTSSLGELDTHVELLWSQTVWLRALAPEKRASRPTAATKEVEWRMFLRKASTRFLSWF